ncbi:MAG: hypothetical protein KIT84_41685 [Labilithrix sp.]|nr:hypothetical protein [Labilithrix sp.]MCW5817585.1 hypothetical protein [Labilithrix sp.]
MVPRLDDRDNRSSSSSSPGLLLRGFAPGTFAATVASTGMIAQQVAGKAVRDALFLSSYRVHHLPHAMAAASVLSLAVVMALPVVTTRISPRRLLPLLFGGSAAGLVLERLLYSASARAGAIAVYLHVSVVAPVILTTFWSLINERFDPHAAKREVARIAGGGTLGGVLGGLAAWRASTLVSVPSAILFLAGINVLCFGAVLVCQRRGFAPTPHPRHGPRAERSGRFAPAFAAASGAPAPAPGVAAMRLVWEEPFLRNLALLVGAGAALSSLLDYVLGVQAVAELGRGPALLAFFSLFGLGVSVLSLVLQVVFGRVAMEKVNLAVHLGVLPGVVLLGGALGLAVPGLVSTAILRGAEMIHRNTLFRSAYELLYTPIPELHKRATKALIDVGFDRTGTIAGALVTMGAVYFISPTHPRSQAILLGLAVAAALATLPLVRRLHRNYVAALEQSLRDDAAAKLDAAPPSVPPETERDRDVLLGRVAAIDPRPDDRGLAHAALTDPAALVAVVADLFGADVERARAALRRLERSDRAAAGPAILLLSRAEVHRDAKDALRRMGAPITGQLVDAMIDPEMDFVVRRRVPPILAEVPSQRAADGLFLALEDVRFEVRYAAGRALMRMLERAEGLTIPHDRIVQTIMNEIAREQEYVDALGDDELEGEALAPLDVVTRDRVSRGLEHLFNELAILLGSAAVKICFRALNQGDARARGTALEYLQTVLPTPLRDALWPLLGEEKPLPSVRPAGEVLADLARAMEHGSDPDQKTEKPSPAPPS